MNKKTFLKKLEEELIKLNVQDISGILEYYDELIEDQKEAGKKEKDIINSFNFDEIIKAVKVHKKINDAVNKPTLSNGVKALLAFLGILSLPMLITFGAIVFVIIITIVAVLFSLLVTFGAVIIASVASIFAIIFAIILGKLPFTTALFLLGSCLVTCGLFCLIFKLAISLSKEMIVAIADYLKNQLEKRNGGKKHE